MSINYASHICDRLISGESKLEQLNSDVIGFVRIASVKKTLTFTLCHSSRSFSSILLRVNYVNVQAYM